MFNIISPNLTAQQKRCPKNWLLLWLHGGALCVLGVHLHIFFCKLHLKRNFHRPGGGAGARTAPRWLRHAVTAEIYPIRLSSVKFYAVHSKCGRGLPFRDALPGLGRSRKKGGVEVGARRLLRRRRPFDSSSPVQSRRSSMRCFEWHL